MNERIIKIGVESSMLNYIDNQTPRQYFLSGFANEEDLELFAQLIVKECIKTIEHRAPGQMGKEGEGWTNGYDDGLKTGAWLLKQHFGIEEPNNSSNFELSEGV